MIEPKISFGMIVLNGEPFIKYNLRALYPFAHQIIVVEGASPAAKSISTPDGHSTDTTLQTLRQFKTLEDPEHKVFIVTAEDEGHINGFWEGEKHEQSRAYSKRATGNYLWQVDVDEFYKPQDIQSIVSMLRSDPAITAVSFPMITFWGALEYIVDGWYLRRGAAEYHRLFKWGEGYEYLTHRPPTVLDAVGRNMRDIRWIRSNNIVRLGIYLYHYSLLLPKQVIEKCSYYQNASWTNSNRAVDWAQNSYLTLNHPFRVHNVYEFPSWLERFDCEHPPQIKAMYDDIVSGISDIELRPTQDVERLLSSIFYKLGRFTLKILDFPDRILRIFLSMPFTLFRIIKRAKKYFVATSG